MELQYLLAELKFFVANRAGINHISDMCNIVIEEARANRNLRIVRGAEAILRRTTSKNFDYDIALREVNAMLRVV